MNITLENTRLLFVVCGNTETLRDGTFAHDESADLLCSELCNELNALPFVGDVHTDKFFPNWHGGKFSHQASMYGYQQFGRAVCVGAIVTHDEVDEDGDPEEVETRISWSRLPQDVRDAFDKQIWEAIARADATAEKHEAELDAEDAKFAADHADE